MAYYFVRTEIDHGFFDPAIVQASSADAARATMDQLAALFGYSVESVTQVSKADAMSMIDSYKAHGIRATKTPRVKLAPAPTSTTSTAEALKPEQQQQIETAVSAMDDDGLKCFLQYLSFLSVLDQQPKIA